MVDKFRDLVYVFEGMLGNREKEPLVRAGTLMVYEGDHALAGSNYRMFTYDLVTCMGITLHNPELRVGLVAHIPDITYTSEIRLDSITSKFSEEIKQKTGSSSSGFNAVVLGLSYYLNKLNCNKWENYVERKMKWARVIKEKLENHGFSVFNSDFTVHCDMRREIILDNNNSKLYISGKLCGDVQDSPVERATVSMDSGEIKYRLNPKWVNKLYFLRE